MVLSCQGSVQFRLQCLFVVNPDMIIGFKEHIVQIPWWYSVLVHSILFVHMEFVIVSSNAYVHLRSYRFVQCQHSVQCLTYSRADFGIVGVGGVSGIQLRGCGVFQTF